MDALDVLILDEPDSKHADLVEHELGLRGAVTKRLNCSALRAGDVEVTPGAWIFSSGEERWAVGPSSTIWLRRVGRAETTDLDPEEAQLARDELPHLLIGGLTGVGARWVDYPSAVAQAEHKLYQLATAERIGLRTAASLVTNDAGAAAAFAGEAPLIAKPLSPGEGIAPFVDQVGVQDLELIAHLPTFLQKLVAASADLRVVVIGPLSWVWSRDREAGVVDWRSVDPHGSAFALADELTVARDAVELTTALGLSMSIQDWLIGPDGPIFLESNPQGAWAFLDESESLVAEALARYLFPDASGVYSDGKWPKPLHRIGWDLRRADNAPANDGVEPPHVLPAAWLPLAARRDDALSVAQRANDEAKESAKAAEEKASRLGQTALAAVAVGTAIGGYQLGVTLDRGGLVALSLIPVAAAICFLAVAAFEAVEIDRVGFYEHASVADLAKQGPRDAMTLVLVREERGRYLASWTSRHKHTALMQARAWFSRGLFALLVAGLVAGVSWGANFADRNDRISTDPSPGASTPTTTAPGAPSTASTVTTGISSTTVPTSSLAPTSDGEP
ncbi:MAG: hypothetical protein GY798_17020 [Hyphomicrobiales bacterium]|nr:hypothetical protein [Hyphomicrobiales bacterium]